MSVKGLTELSKRKLLDKQSIITMDFYEHCVFGKQKRVIFSTTKHCTRGPLEYINLALWGPTRVVSKGGLGYLLTISDDFFRKVRVYFSKLKNDVFSVFKS